MTKPKIPFGWLPGHWGLRGKTRLIAQAEYELSGLELDLKLAEINHEDPGAQEMAKLDARLKHKAMDAYEYDVAYARARLKGDHQLDEALVEIDLKHNKITQAEHDRKLADLRGEPWVAMPNMRWDPADPSKSYFELDYNDHFVVFLRKHNYQGITDEQVVETWLTDVCRAVAADMAQEDPAFVSQAVTPVTRKRTRKKKAEYS